MAEQPTLVLGKKPRRAAEAQWSQAKAVPEDGPGDASEAGAGAGRAGGDGGGGGGGGGTRGDSLPAKGVSAVGGERVGGERGGRRPLTTVHPSPLTTVHPSLLTTVHPSPLTTVHPSLRSRSLTLGEVCVAHVHTDVAD